jgi:hypothetical protein
MISSNQAKSENSKLLLQLSKSEEASDARKIEFENKIKELGKSKYLLFDEGLTGE